MRTIYKYTISPERDQLEINAPVIRFLSAQAQRGEIRIWAEVDTDMPDRYFGFIPIGTGWNLSEFQHFDKATYLDTVQVYGGDLVWHLYYLELKEPFGKLRT